MWANTDQKAYLIYWLPWKNAHCVTGDIEQTRKQIAQFAYLCKLQAETKNIIL